jgi:hypothetical protein
VLAWLATFFAAVVAGASILVATWAIWLMVAPAEEIHFEWAIPGLVLAGAGALVAMSLWIRGR